jgi:predicted solute-binding protein
MRSRTLRVGTVDYLNARPLTWGIERGTPGLAIELSSAVPALLAEQMRRGEIDVALLPIVELARTPELEIVPDVAIAARGAARSVLLVGRGDPRSIATLALDPESRTSNVLARVVLDLMWGVRPDVVAGDVDLDRALARADAAVRIGDKALFETPPGEAMLHDLALEWTRATGCPSCSPCGPRAPV